MYAALHTVIFGGKHYRLYLYAGYVCWFLLVFLSIQCNLLNRNKITGIFYISGIVESFVCIFQILGAVKSANGFFSVTGTFENPNITAMFLMAC